MPVGRTHWRVVIAIGIGLFFDLYGIFLSSTISQCMKTSFIISEKAELSALLAGTFIGMFVGSAVIGGIADRIGRKKAFIFNLLWYSIWSIIAAFSPSFWVLVVIRAIAGIGLGAQYPVADSYLQEILPKLHRGWLASWAYTISFLAVPFVGFLALGLTSPQNLGDNGWRWLLALGGIGGLLALFVKGSLIESPRWLAAMGRWDEAKIALTAFAEGAEVRVDPIRFDQRVVSSATKKGSLSARWQQLRKPMYAKRLAMLSTFHLFQTFGYYGFSVLSTLVLLSHGETTQNSLLFTALALLGYPTGSLISTPLIQAFSRRVLLIGSMAAMALSGLGFALGPSSTLIIAFGFMIVLANNVFSNVYHIYQAEIFPTEARVTAVGWGYSVSRLSTAALPFVLLPALDNWGPPAAFSIVAAALLIACSSIVLFGPKTANRSLAEINPS